MPTAARLRTWAICLLATACAVSCVVFAPAAQAAATARALPAATVAPVVAKAPPSAPPAPRYALVTQDAVPLRSGAKAGGAPLALLTQGELLELRGERLDYLQVYDPARERGGYVRANAVRALTLAPDEAPELLALVRFLRDRAGSESLGLGLAAAYLKAAPAGSINAEVFDAMGTMAERLAWRANVAARERGQRAGASRRARHRGAAGGGGRPGRALREPGARRPRLRCATTARPSATCWRCSPRRSRPPARRSR